MRMNAPANRRMSMCIFINSIPIDFCLGSFDAIKDLHNAMRAQAIKHLHAAFLALKDAGIFEQPQMADAAGISTPTLSVISRTVLSPRASSSSFLFNHLMVELPD